VTPFIKKYVSSYPVWKQHSAAEYSVKQFVCPHVPGMNSVRPMGQLLLIMQLINVLISFEQAMLASCTQVPFIRSSEQLQYDVSGHAIVTWSQ
jgi:hypothetical protein